MDLRFSTLSALIIALTLMVFAVGASPVLVEADFDGAEYSLGSLDGQNGWTVLQGTATIVDDGAAHSGARSVSLAQNTVVDRSISAPGQAIVWTRTHFRGAGTDVAPNYPSGEAASAIVHFSSTDGIQLADGDGAGGYSAWVNTGVSIDDDGTWYEILIRQDYTNQLWDCYIDGTLEGQDLGFRDNSVTQLNGFRQYAGVASSMDTFLTRYRSPGDLDGDGDSDASDVVLNVNAENSPPTDPIAFSDADFDDDGVIEPEDVTATVNLILSN
ncbi:hypothetical protein JXA47_15950 [Candidatus Sumerlaeota bacterium]|nr:hypothetical protein [Candidatus Sumerlaeota bacterium]